MPTVVLLDVSLSMLRQVDIPDCSETYQRKHLAIHGINSFLDYVSANCKLEFISLVVFSSLWEQLVPFTRNYDTIRSHLSKLEDYDKTCIESGLSAAGSVITEEWGSENPSQVILITDGSLGIGLGSLRQSLQTIHQRGPEEKFPLPFTFPCKLHVVTITNPNEPNIQHTSKQYQKLIDINGQGGEVFIPEGQLTLKSVQQMFTKLSEKYFTPMSGLLKCGHLKCNVQVFPAPSKYNRSQEFKHTQKDISNVIDICGFLDIKDVASPPFISRHLVLPKSTAKDDQKNDGDSSESKDDEDEDTSDDGKVPSVTVLLHGSLKVENMVALAQIGEDWYGMMYSWADNKKKSNLMLSIFEPGVDAIPWLGKLNKLLPHTTPELRDSPPYGEEDDKSPFPVKPVDRRSYAQNCVVWIKAAGLQADIQKILRHARKLPDKIQQFYKELNRVRKAALALGFLELLDSLSAMLERECTLLPGTAHPDAALQLSHAANSLRSENSREYGHNILPLNTNFTGAD